MRRLFFIATVVIFILFTWAAADVVCAATTEQVLEMML